MRTVKSLGLIVGLSTIAAMSAVSPARADRFFNSDISGTNVWNSTAPRFGTASPVDPELIENVTRINRDSPEALRACDEAVTTALQNITVRRFSRTPQPQEFPEACQRLESLRGESETLRVRLDQLQAERAKNSPALKAW